MQLSHFVNNLIFESLICSKLNELEIAKGKNPAHRPRIQNQMSKYVAKYLRSNWLNSERYIGITLMRYSNYIIIIVDRK